MMSAGFISQLIERFPEFFPAELTAAGTRARVIACGDGWLNLINHLLGTLHCQVRTSPLERMRQLVLVRIDRDQGLLRIRFRRPSQRVRLLSASTEDLASTYCEMCGMPGQEFFELASDMRIRCSTHVRWHCLTQ